MNNKIGQYSAIVNVCAVAAFAICMIFAWNYGSYLVCMFIAFSFIPLICAFCANSEMENKAAAYTSLAFAAIYGVFILIVYFTQVTSVANDPLTDQAKQILDYQKFGLFFSLDLLGYGLMALSTFFAGLTIKVKNKIDKWLKRLFMIHGIFFISCLIMPMLNVFSPDMQGADLIGVVVLEFWCVYFIPIGILCFLHFKGANS